MKLKLKKSAVTKTAKPSPVSMTLYPCPTLYTKC